jgi:hypothetical protein
MEGLEGGRGRLRTGRGGGWRRSGKVALAPPVAGATADGSAGGGGGGTGEEDERPLPEEGRRKARRKMTRRSCWAGPKGVRHLSTPPRVEYWRPRKRARGGPTARHVPKRVWPRTAHLCGKLPCRPVGLTLRPRHVRLGKTGLPICAFWAIFVVWVFLGFWTINSVMLVRRPRQGGRAWPWCVAG